MLTNDYRVFVLKFIYHIIQGNPISILFMQKDRNEIGLALLDFCEDNSLGEEVVEARNSINDVPTTFL